MSEFIEQEPLKTLEAPKKQRNPRAPKVESQAPYDVKEDLFDLTFLEEDLVATETPVAKRGKGRPPKKVVEDEDVDVKPPKPKRIQSEAQKANFQKALAQRQANIALRKAAKEAEKQVKEAEVEAKKKDIERKVVKKAICLKKKEILSQACLEDISDEEIPDEIVQKIVKKQRAKSAPKPKQVVIQEPVAPPAPKYNFV
jgi:hypothetical protein